MLLPAMKVVERSYHWYKSHLCIIAHRLFVIGCMFKFVRDVFESPCGYCTILFILGTIDHFSLCILISFHFLSLGNTALSMFCFASDWMYLQYFLGDQQYIF